MSKDKELAAWLRMTQESHDGKVDATFSHFGQALKGDSLQPPGKQVLPLTRLNKTGTFLLEHSIAACLSSLAVMEL